MTSCLLITSFGESGFWVDLKKCPIFSVLPGSSRRGQGSGGLMKISQTELPIVIPFLFRLFFLT